MGDELDDKWGAVVVVIKNNRSDMLDHEIRVIYGSGEGIRGIDKIVKGDDLISLYKCDGLIIVRHPRSIKKSLKGSLGEVVDNCKSDLSICFIFDGRTLVGDLTIDVSDVAQTVE